MRLILHDRAQPRLTVAAESRRSRGGIPVKESPRLV